MRDEFARTMVALYRERNDLVFITGDVGYLAIEPIAEAYGERFVNAGIAEQNMVSLAAGLAREGHLPWVYSIAPFVAFRPYEQIRTDVCLHRLAVKLVGNGGGYGYGIMGASHHALEDVGAMRVLPHMRVYLPLTRADVSPAVSMMAAGSAAELPAAEHRRPDSGRGSPVRAVAKDQARSKVRRDWNGARSSATCTTSAMRRCSTISRSGTWGCSPSARCRADLLASIAEKQRLVTLEEHYLACGMAEALSHRC